MKLFSKSASRIFLSLFLSLSTLAEVTTIAAYSDPVPGGKPKIKVGSWKLPDNPVAGHIRVKMLRSEICNSDRRVLAGTKISTVIQQKIVLGHEGIGVIESFGPNTEKASHLKVGDLVVLGPHLVQKDDPLLKQGTPNLSKQMKHLGMHIHGVFADLMDFAEYQVNKVVDKKTLAAVKNQEAYLDQMVMIEPLACVQRGYKLLAKQDYFKKGLIKSALILGAGPMGVIHTMHLQKKFPQVRVDIYDIDPIRQNLTQNIAGLKAQALASLDSKKQYDLVVTATSNRDANVKSAVEAVKNNGVILLFSGIDMNQSEQRPILSGVDIETVHRYEGSVRLMNHEINGSKKSIYFLGTSGYVEDDFKTSIQELSKDFELGNKSLYKGVSSTVIEGLESPIAKDLTQRYRDAKFNEPALVPLLKLYDPSQTGDENVHNYLKISVRHK